MGCNSSKELEQENLELRQVLELHDQQLLQERRARLHWERYACELTKTQQMHALLRPYYRPYAFILAQNSDAFVVKPTFPLATAAGQSSIHAQAGTGGTIGSPSSVQPRAFRGSLIESQTVNNNNNASSTPPMHPSIAAALAAANAASIAQPGGMNRRASVSSGGGGPASMSQPGGTGGTFISSAESQPSMTPGGGGGGGGGASADGTSSLSSAALERVDAASRAFESRVLKQLSQQKYDPLDVSFAKPTLAGADPNAGLDDQDKHIDAAALARLQASLAAMGVAGVSQHVMAAATQDQATMGEGAPTASNTGANATKNIDFSKCTLVQLLSHPVTLEFVKDELQRLHSVESLVFWQDVQQYKRVRNVKLRRILACQMYKHFIAAGAEQQININTRQRQQIEAIMKHGNADLFTDSIFQDAERESMLLMETNLLKFNQTQTYRLCCAVLKQSHALFGLAEAALNSSDPDQHGHAQNGNQSQISAHDDAHQSALYEAELEEYRLEREQLPGQLTETSPAHHVAINGAHYDPAMDGIHLPALLESKRNSMRNSVHVSLDFGSHNTAADRSTPPVPSHANGASSNSHLRVSSIGNLLDPSPQSKCRSSKSQLVITEME